MTAADSVPRLSRIAEVDEARSAALHTTRRYVANYTVIPAWSKARRLQLSELCADATEMVLMSGKRCSLTGKAVVE